MANKVSLPTKYAHSVEEFNNQHAQDHTYEKTLLAKRNFKRILRKPVLNQSRQALCNEYTLNFLKLGDTRSERGCKRAISDRIEQFPTLFIGMILCREKKRVVVEYALRENNKLIGLATYHIVRRLPAQLKGDLSNPKQIERLLGAVEWPNETVHPADREGV